MIAKNKTRITITIEKKTLEHIKKLTKQYNVSISDLINDQFAPIEPDYNIIHAEWIK